MFARMSEAAKKAETAPTATAEKAPVAPEQVATETTTQPVAEAAQAASTESQPEGAVTETVEATSEEATAQPEHAEPAQAEATEDTEHDGGDEDVLSPKSSQKVAFTPEQQKLFEKRLGKEIAKTKAITSKFEEEVSRLRSELDETRQKIEAPAQQQQQRPAAAATPTGPQPLAEINDPNALAALRSQAKEAIRFVEDTLETPRAWKARTVADPDTGEEVTVRVAKVGDQDMTEEQLRAVRRQAKLTLEDHIPQREQYLVARSKTQQIAHEEFPFLKDKQTAEYQQAQQLRQNPWMQQNPHSEYIIGAYLFGLKKLAEAKATAKAAAATPAKPKVAQQVVRTSSDQTAPAATATAGRIPIATGAKQALRQHQEKMKAKRGLTVEEAQADLLTRESLRNSS